MRKKIDVFLEKIIIKNSIQGIEKFRERLRDHEVSFEINPLNLGYRIPLNKPLELVAKGLEIALKSKLKSMEKR